MGCLSTVESLEADTARRAILGTEVGRNFGEDEVRDGKGILLGEKGLERSRVRCLSPKTSAKTDPEAC